MPRSEAQIDHALGFVYATEASWGDHPAPPPTSGRVEARPVWSWARAGPAVDVVLMDASQRRTEFLNDEVGTWGGLDRGGRGSGPGRGAGPGRAVPPAFRGGDGPVVRPACRYGRMRSSRCWLPGGVMVVSEPPGRRVRESVARGGTGRARTQPFGPDPVCRSVRVPGAGQVAGHP